MTEPASEPHDPTELAGIADADTQSTYAWGGVDDQETEDFSSKSGWLTSKRITITAVGISLIATARRRLLRESIHHVGPRLRGRARSANRTSWRGGDTGRCTKHLIGE
jgi:hypothetical protein